MLPLSHFFKIQQAKITITEMPGSNGHRGLTHQRRFTRVFGAMCTWLPVVTPVSVIHGLSDCSLQSNLFRTNTKGPMIFVCINGSSSYPYDIRSEYTGFYSMELRILVLLKQTFVLSVFFLTMVLLYLECILCIL